MIGVSFLRNVERCNTIIYQSSVVYVEICEVCIEEILSAAGNLHLHSEEAATLKYHGSKSRNSRRGYYARYTILIRMASVITFDTAINDHEEKGSNVYFGTLIHTVLHCTRMYQSNPVTYDTTITMILAAGTDWLIVGPRAKYDEEMFIISSPRATRVSDYYVCVMR